MATSAYLGLNILAKGAQANEWGTIQNDNLNLIDKALGARFAGNPEGQNMGTVPSYKGQIAYDETNHRIFVSKTSGVATADTSYEMPRAIVGFNADAAGKTDFIYYASAASASISAGNIGLTGAVRITGNTTIDGNVVVQSNVSVSGELQVFGTASFMNDVYVSGTLSVGGDLAVGGAFTPANLSMAGSATVGDNLTVKGSASIAGDLHVGGDLSVTGTLDANAITYPLSDGTAGDVIITDGAGALSFTDPDLVDINAEENASFVLASADQGGYLRASAASTIEMTLPASASVGLVAGFQCVVVQKGAGPLKLIAGSGVTLDTFSDLVLTAGSHIGVWVVKEGNDVWAAYGDLV